MSDTPWGVGNESPMNEGAEETAVGPGHVGEQRAAEDETAQGRRESDDRPKLNWGDDEVSSGEALDDASTPPNLDGDPPVSGRRSTQPPGETTQDAGGMGNAAWPGGSH